MAAAFFASECRAGLVQSFEPVEPLLRLLEENLRRFPGCIAHRYGLSSAPGEAKITYYPNATAMSSLYADADDDRERVRTSCSTAAFPRRLSGLQRSTRRSL